MSAREDVSRFVNAAIACAYANDLEALRRGFADLPDPLRLSAAQAVSDRLERHAQVTGRWSTWARALHVLPRPGWREGGVDLCDRLDVWRVQRARRYVWRDNVAQSSAPTDYAARSLKNFARKLVRADVPSAVILRRLDEANATLPDPVSAEQVGDIALRACQVEGGSHVAR